MVFWPLISQKKWTIKECTFEPRVFPKTYLPFYKVHVSQASWLCSVVVIQHSASNQSYSAVWCWFSSGADIADMNLIAIFWIFSLCECYELDTRMPTPEPAISYKQVYDKRLDNFMLSTQNRQKTWKDVFQTEIYVSVTLAAITMTRVKQMQMSWCSS